MFVRAFKCVIVPLYLCVFVRFCSYGKSRKREIKSREIFAQKPSSKFLTLSAKFEIETWILSRILYGSIEYIIVDYIWLGFVNHEKM